jgi:predicted Ser/Thr protein kinase
MQKQRLYVLKAGKEISPVFESPLGLFDPLTQGPEIERRYGIPIRRLTGKLSPWAVKRLEEFGGDITKFTVVGLQPSRHVCIAKPEPIRDTALDISSLTGKVHLALEVIALVHSNDSEWQAAKANQELMRRIYVVNFPRFISTAEERKAYELLIRKNGLRTRAAAMTQPDAGVDQRIRAPREALDFDGKVLSR